MFKLILWCPSRHFVAAPTERWFLCITYTKLAHPINSRFWWGGFKILRVPVCLFSSTWTCCAQPQNSSRKWRQRGDGGSQLHSGFQLDYKLIWSGPAKLWGSFPELPLFGRCGVESPWIAACLSASPWPFWGIFSSCGQGGHPFELTQLVGYELAVVG